MTKIIVGVSGSIAAYKSAELVRLLKKSHYEVRVIMTQSAAEIITPMTLQVLSQNDVRMDLFDHEDEAKIDHISLARWADHVIIAPATANVMAKIACGLADDLLTTICLATDSPIAIAPAMNRLMWENPATQDNLATLLARGCQLIPPDSGEQACGEVGTGRMAEPENIMRWLEDNVLPSRTKPHVEPCVTSTNNPNHVLFGKNVVITAGPTIERIDPVRFISNDSSGKMGYALAEAAANMGANVVLVSGKTALPAPAGVKRINVGSADDMLAVVMQHIDNADWFIATAAVSDYRVAEPAEQKMKKDGTKGLTLELVQNPDILKSVCALPDKPFCIGFAAETEKLLEHAGQKRRRKGADLIVANDVSDKHIGFNSDNNAATLIGEDFQQHFPVMSKPTLAEKLLLASLAYQKKHEK